MMRNSGKGLIFVLALSLVVLPIRLNAADPALEKGTPLQSSEPSVAEDLGYGVGSVLLSIFYSPAKITYAGLGLITSGLGFVLSGGNTEVATNIMNPAVRGHYVITPRHLKGEEPLIFVGPSNFSEPRQEPPPTQPQR